MRKPLLLGATVAAALSGILVGCNSSTDVPKDVNDAYHNKDPGKPPTAEQLKQSKSGPGFVGQPTSLPQAGGVVPPGGPPAGSGAPAPKAGG
jgi:hypothetical protein